MTSRSCDIEQGRWRFSCKYRFPHISANTAHITMLKYAPESPSIDLSNGTQTAKIGAGDPLLQPYQGYHFCCPGQHQRCPCVHSHPIIMSKAPLESSHQYLPNAPAFIPISAVLRELQGYQYYPLLMADMLPTRLGWSKKRPDKPLMIYRSSQYPRQSITGF